MQHLGCEGGEADNERLALGAGAIAKRFDQEADLEARRLMIHCQPHSHLIEVLHEEVEEQHWSVLLQGSKHVMVRRYCIGQQNDSAVQLGLGQVYESSLGKNMLLFSDL